MVRQIDVMLVSVFIFCILYFYAWKCIIWVVSGPLPPLCSERNLLLWTSRFPPKHIFSVFFSNTLSRHQVDFKIFSRVQSSPAGRGQIAHVMLCNPLLALHLATALSVFIPRMNLIQLSAPYSVASDRNNWWAVLSPKVALTSRPTLDWQKGSSRGTRGVAERVILT